MVRHKTLGQALLVVLACGACAMTGCVNLDQQKRPSRFGFKQSDAPTRVTKAPMKKTPEAMLKATKSKGASFVSQITSVLPQKVKQTIPDQVLADDDPTRLDNAPKDLGPGLYVAAARLSEKSGRYEAALNQYNMALKADGTDRNALIGMARLQHRLGKTDAAIRIYHDALNIYRNDSVIMNDLGLCYARNKQLDQAISVLRAATQIAPEREIYWNNLAAALIEAERTGEAFEYLTQRDGQALANYKIGYLLDRAGRKPESEPYLSKALALNPNLTQARELLNELVPQVSALPYESRPQPSSSQPTAVQAPRQLGRPMGHLAPAVPADVTRPYRIEPSQRRGPFGFVPTGGGAKHQVVTYVEDE